MVGRAGTGRCAGGHGEGWWDRWEGVGGAVGRAGTGGRAGGHGEAGGLVGWWWRGGGRYGMECDKHLKERLRLERGWDGGGAGNL